MLAFSVLLYCLVLKFKMLAQTLGPGLFWQKYGKENYIEGFGERPFANLLVTRCIYIWAGDPRPGPHPQLAAPCPARGITTSAQRALCSDDAPGVGVPH